MPADGGYGSRSEGEPGENGGIAEPPGRAGRPLRRPLRRAWRSWRNWRRSRPFWGGLLIIAGGAEILSTSVVSLGVALRAGLGGLGGFPGTVIALVLVLSGVLLWFSPAQRVFYSIVAVVLAIATFNTINYGGFLIGMLLGIVGGALAFAWVPGPGMPRGRPARRGIGPGRWTGRLRPPGGGSDAGHLLAIAMAALIAPGHALTGRAPAMPAMSPAGCILFVICTSPTPVASPPASGPSAPPLPRPVPNPSPTRAAPGGRPPGPPKAPGKPGGLRRASPPRGGLLAAASPSQLTAGSARLAGLAYDGVAEVPRAIGPPLPMMKFTLSSATLTGRPTLTIHEHGTTAVTTTSVLSFSGHVVLYATKLSGDLLGVPVTITASSPLSLVLRVLKPLTGHATVTMTQVTTDQPLATSASSQWSSFLISVP